MNTKTIRNAAIAASVISLSVISTAQAALTVNAIGESAVANELRSMTKTDWATVNNVTMMIPTTGFTFLRDDTSDNGIPFATFATGGASLTIEEIFSSAGYTNDLHILAGNTFLMSNKPLANTDGVRIRTNTPSESLDLVFLTNTAGGYDASAAGDVHLYDDANLRTYVYRDGMDTHYVWMLEDINSQSSRNDHDYNDYVFYAKLSAVPEPSTIITGIAIGFLGLTVLRRRFSEKKAVA
ncbi:MAG: PEP-CTERM sorting domain-containing protein [Opitutaceae bacterium]